MREVKERVSKDASNQRVGALEKTLSDQESELATQTVAVNDLCDQVASIAQTKHESEEVVPSEVFDYGVRVKFLMRPRTSSWSPM